MSFAFSSRGSTAWITCLLAVLVVIALPQKAAALTVNLCYLPRISSTNAMSALHSRYAHLQLENQTDPGITWTWRYVAENGNANVQNSRKAIAELGQDCDVYFGPGSSSTSVALSALIDTAWVDYASTSTELSDKNDHPNFSRVLPTDEAGGRALAAIVRHFGWNSIAIICTSESYGNSITRAITTSIQSFATVASSNCVLQSATKAELKETLSSTFQTLTATRVIAVAMTSSGSAFEDFVDAVLELGMDKTHVFLFVEAACSGNTKWLSVPGAICATASVNQTRLNAFLPGYLSKPASLANELAAVGVPLQTINLERSTIYGAFGHDAVQHTMLAINSAYRGNTSLDIKDRGMLLGIIRSYVSEGLTGTIALESNGDRLNSNMVVFNAQPGSNEVVVGSWQGADVDIAVRMYWLSSGFIATPSTSSSPPPSDDDDSSLTTTAIIVIAVFGGVVIIILIVAAVIFRKKQHENEHLVRTLESVQIRDDDDETATIRTSRTTVTIAETDKEDFRQREAEAGRYTRGKLIGRGANASVYVALLRDGSSLAVKISNLSAAHHERQLATIRREVEILRGVSHPCVVKYYGVKEDLEHHRVHVFMELLPGGSLSSMVRNLSCALPEQAARSYIAQIGMALEVLHHRKIAHRDLKGDNVLLDANGGVRLADFGAAKVQEASEAGQTITGTPYFMAPETIADGTTGIESDIWAFGIAAAELMNHGKVPWPTFDSAWAALRHIQVHDPELPTHMSEEAIDFIRQCTVRNMKERPTIDELMRHPFVCNEVVRLRQRHAGANNSHTILNGSSTSLGQSLHQDSIELTGDQSAENPLMGTIDKVRNNTAPGLTIVSSPDEHSSSEPAVMPTPSLPRAYRLERLIGTGSDGDVYNATLSDGANAVAKRLVFVDDSRRDRRIVRIEEAVNLYSKAPPHPHVVRYLKTHRVDDDPGAILVFMEFFGTSNLARMVRRGRLKEAVAAKNLREATEALAHLHANDVVHLNFKPANILVNSDGFVKVTDYGALRADLRADTAHLSVVGTPQYMAPEVVRQESGSAASDIWSLGCTTMELLTGKAPWSHIAGGTALHVLSYVMGEEPLTLPDDVKGDARDFIARCLVRDPAQRPTAAELLQHAWLSSAVPSSGEGLS